MAKTPLIKKIFARQIIDSRGFPTVEADLWLTDGSFGRAAIPSGASTGASEAVELRDGGNEWAGKGVLKAVNNVNWKIANKLKKFPADQLKVDAELVGLDGTPNKAKLGANATLAVSLALSRALAGKQELHSYLGKGKRIPTPMFNVINGGKHAGGNLAVQEFMLVPIGVRGFSDKLRAGVEIYQALKKKLRDKYGVSAINVGDEGGFAPPIDNTGDAVNILLSAIDSSGYSGKVSLSLDSAATSFYSEGKYSIDGKTLSPEEMVGYYLDLSKEFPQFYSFEDPLDENDFDGFASLLKELPAGKIVIGDDLYTTNVERMKTGISKKSTNGLLLKVNQIGTLTEAISAFKLAKKSKWIVAVSHRSGETTDDYIADLAVALGAEFLKAGAPCRGERLAKYNRLLRIDETL